MEGRGLFGSIGGIIGSAVSGPAGGVIGTIAGNAIEAIANEVIKKDLSEQDKAVQLMEEAGASPADVVCWSGCLDNQTVSKDDRRVELSLIPVGRHL